MKKYLSILFCLIFGFSYAQETRSARIKSDSKLETYKETGVFKFKMDEALIPEEVEKHAKNYTAYFSVELNSNHKWLTVTLNENNKKNRQVIIRLLKSLQIEEIQIAKEKLNTERFYKTHLSYEL